MLFVIIKQMICYITLPSKCVSGYNNKYIYECTASCATEEAIQEAMLCEET